MEDPPHHNPNAKELKAGIVNNIIPLCGQMEMHSDYFYIKGVVLGSVQMVYVKTTNHMTVGAMVLDQDNTQRIVLVWDPKAQAKQSA